VLLLELDTIVKTLDPVGKHVIGLVKLGKMIKLINLLKEISYSFSEYDTTYDDEDNSLIDVEYTFKTEKNKYKVIFSSKEKAREFEVSFGIDTGNFNKIDTFQMTGEGDARNILQTLADIINDFYYQYDEEIDKIIIKGTNEKRSKIYKQFLPKYLSPSTMSKVKIL
jgi:hypothetical protein